MAGKLAWKLGRFPTREETVQAAQPVRLELAQQAWAASSHLGEPPDEIGRSEADVRIFIHDLIHLDHDKDYRCLAAFPSEFFADVGFNIIRMDPHGGVTTERIEGCGYHSPKSPDLWLLVSEGHMRLLRPSSSFPQTAFGS